LGHPLKPAAGALATLTLATLTLSACGVGAGPSTGAVDLLVTGDFGAARLGHVKKDAPGSETVMRFLERNFKVKTRYGGGFVQSIDGLAGGHDHGRQVDWFYFVNGIEADEGAATTKLHRGDRVWWDRRDWSVTPHIPAVVGSFPEPLRSGIDGKRYPVRIECVRTGEKACDMVTDRLRDVGVPTSRALLGAPAGDELLRVVVGVWRDIRRDTPARRLEQGPRTSGVFARPARTGDSIEVLDERGRVALTLTAGAGLVAATRFGEQKPTWVVTGTDERGLLAAAGALEQERLEATFALAIANGRDDVRVPRIAR
jgi:hypothetical protein